MLFRSRKSALSYKAQESAIVMLEDFTFCLLYTSGELIVKSGEEITEAKAKAIDESPIESVEISSVLTCESNKGVCMKCYGRNLATARMVQLGEAVGVIAAQAIGEPGTQSVSYTHLLRQVQAYPL